MVPAARYAYVHARNACGIAGHRRGHIVPVIADVAERGVVLGIAGWRIQALTIIIIYTWSFLKRPLFFCFFSSLSICLLLFLFSLCLFPFGSLFHRMSMSCLSYLLILIV